MPNAKDLHIETAPKKILLVGKAGGGKTTQLITLPGKKFLYIFDPNSLHSIQGFDVDYETFFPDLLNLDVRSLSKEARGKTLIQTPKPEAYTNWEMDFEKRLKEGFFDEYDVIGWDSWTTFGDSIMDRILDINGRRGQFPQKDDYGPQMITMANVFRTATAMGKTIFCTAHEELVQDKVSGKIQNQILVTGKLRVRLPTLFSDILHCTAGTDTKKGVTYTLQTRPNRENPVCRCSVRGAEPFEDATIEDWTRPGDFGLGRLFHQPK